MNILGGWDVRFNSNKDVLFCSLSIKKKLSIPNLEGNEIKGTTGGGYEKQYHTLFK